MKTRRIGHRLDTQAVGSEPARSALRKCQPDGGADSEVAVLRLLRHWQTTRFSASPGLSSSIPERLHGKSDSKHDRKHGLATLDITAT